MDGNVENLLFDAGAKTDIELREAQMLRNEENYIQRPHVFPPEECSSCFSDIKAKSYNLDEAIIRFHHQILKERDLSSFLRALKFHLPRVIELAPSSFHFILHAIQSVVKNIDSEIPVDPVHLYILRQIISSKAPDKPFFVRDLLDFQLREVIHRLFDVSFKVKPEENDKIYQEAGNVFSQEGQEVQAILCYTKSLEENSRNAKVYYLRGILYLKRGQNDLAAKDFEQALLINPSHTESASLLVKIKDDIK